MIICSKSMISGCGDSCNTNSIVIFKFRIINCQTTPVRVPNAPFVTVAPIPVADGLVIVLPIDETSISLLVEIPVISYNLLYSFLAKDVMFSTLIVSPTLLRILVTVTSAGTKGVMLRCQYWILSVHHSPDNLNLNSSSSISVIAPDELTVILALASTPLPPVNAIIIQTLNSTSVITNPWNQQH